MYFHWNIVVFMLPSEMCKHDIPAQLQLTITEQQLLVVPLIRDGQNYDW